MPSSRVISVGGLQQLVQKKTYRVMSNQTDIQARNATQVTVLYVKEKLEQDQIYTFFYHENSRESVFTKFYN